MTSVLKYIFRPFLQRYHDLLRRLHDAEVALDSVILSPNWILDVTKVFNGQEERQKIFLDIVDAFKVGEVIETGTFLGDTTGYFAYKLPKAIIRSCELSPRFCELAKRRLTQFSNIQITCGDSRLFLSSLETRRSDSLKDITFIYLDAHWHSDLPLREELEILTRKRSVMVIMIDDFEVPNDPGYAFDNYGRGKDLTLSTFLALFNRLELHSFFPASCSRMETGYRRGCVVLAPKGPLEHRLAQIKTLVRADH